MIERFIDDWAIETSRHWIAALRLCANAALLNCAIPNAQITDESPDRQSSIINGSRSVVLA
jgi:hypothetical protein